MASNISPEDVADLRAQFHKIDVKGDGSISSDELKRLLRGQMEGQQLQVGRGGECVARRPDHQGCAADACTAWAHSVPVLLCDCGCGAAAAGVLHSCWCTTATCATDLPGSCRHTSCQLSPHAQPLPASCTAPACQLHVPGCKHPEDSPHHSMPSLRPSNRHPAPATAAMPPDAPQHPEAPHVDSPPLLYTPPQDVLRAADTNRDGQITLHEFLAATLSLTQLEPSVLAEQLVAAFRSFDKDGSGTLSKRELAEVRGGCKEHTCTAPSLSTLWPGGLQSSPACHWPALCATPAPCYSCSVLLLLRAAPAPLTPTHPPTTTTTCPTGPGAAGLRPRAHVHH
jgi:Ca2+-binding EF-hand superfamily protein